MKQDIEVLQSTKYDGEDELGLLPSSSLPPQPSHQSSLLLSSSSSPFLGQAATKRSKKKFAFLGVLTGILLVVCLLAVLFWFTQTSLKENSNDANVNTQLDKYDLIVYGATPSGCAAAIAAGEAGSNVLLLEPTGHVGGMATEGGIGLRDGVDGTRITDPRNSQVRWGKLNALHYGYDTFTVWQPDNAVGEKSFIMLLKEAGVEVRLYTDIIEGPYGVRMGRCGGDLDGEKELQCIKALRVETSLLVPQEVHGQFFIDASYEGELLRSSRVSYSFGRESRDTYYESWAGITNRSASNFPKMVSPFQTKNSSKLLPYIQDRPDPRKHVGKADDGVMAYSFRVCLTQDPDNRVNMTPPDGYDPNDFELARRLIVAETLLGKELSAPWINYEYFGYSNIADARKMKYDACCGFSPFGIDNPGLAVGYADGTRAEREQIVARHRYFVQGLMWFWMTDPSVPESIRTRHSQFGLCKDEWADNGHFPRQLYVREAIRMVGDKVFTQSDRTKECLPDSIAVATWFFDIHNIQRVAIKDDNSWSVMNEGLVGYDEDPRYPFDLPYWIILPKKHEVANLAATNCPSVSHVAFSAIREEPTLWSLGHAAGLAATIAVSDGLVSFHDVDVRKLQDVVKMQGGRVHFPAAREC